MCNRRRRWDSLRTLGLAITSLPLQTNMYKYTLGLCETHNLWVLKLHPPSSNVLAEQLDAGSTKNQLMQCVKTNWCSSTSEPQNSVIVVHQSLKRSLSKLRVHQQKSICTYYMRINPTYADDAHDAHRQMYPHSAWPTLIWKL